MGAPITGKRGRRTLVALAIAGAALFISLPGAGTSNPVEAATCADQALQAPGSTTLTGCGSSGLRAGSVALPEAHFAATGNTAGASESQRPSANATIGRANRTTTASNASGGGAAAPLPPRKTIDISQLPPELVSPAQ